MTAPDLELRRWEGEPVEHWRERWEVPTLRIFERTGSTNDVARRLAEEGATEGTVVIADRQTAGRGRAGRPWHAPPGKSLLLSIILRPRWPMRGAQPTPGALPLRIGLATARAAERVAGVRLGIKWPNDLLAGGRKVAGILCEGALSGAPGDFVVVGIGVNVGQVAGEFPPAIAGDATSLGLLAGRPVSRSDLAGAMIREILCHGDLVAAPLDDDELRGLEARDPLRGQRITVDGRPRGSAVGIAADGALLVRAGDGTLSALIGGTVRTAHPCQDVSPKDDP